MASTPSPVSSLVTRSKTATRRLVDRAMLPYFDTLRDEFRERGVDPAPSSVSEDVDSTDAPTGRTSDMFHHVLHELRTLELERIPSGRRRVLSVGASGRWYFDWFERHVGAVDEHIGVEAFEDQPHDLPDYVRWVDSTADRFEGVDDDSVDLVFAGQTTEHLWADELVGFLTESNRVLPDGGMLVADSPNGLVTEHLDWSHGGHTLELAAGEMAELMVLAGFEVMSTRGLWLCRMGDDVVGLEDGLDDGALLVRRINLAAEDPDDSFVWWISARRVGAADVDALMRRVVEFFDEHWSTRISRGMWPGPGAAGPAVEPGFAGQLCASLPMYLHPQQWELSVTLDEGSWDDLEGFRVDITSPGGHIVHRMEMPAADGQGATRRWTFDQDELMLALSIELHVERVSSPMRVGMPVRLAAG